jgi:hypothetical protein
MKKILILAVPVLFLLILSSCKKESSSSNSQDNLQGSWKLVSISGISEVTDNYQEFGSTFKDIATYTYSSTSVSGTYEITATHFNGKGIAYNTTGNISFKGYENGVLYINFTQPSPASIPASNSTSVYKKVGTDSLYFSSGSLINISSGTSSPVTPGGLKYKLEGTKLTINTGGSEKSTVSENGVTINRTLNATATIILQK